MQTQVAKVGSEFFYY